jgi:hypothetical protein
MNFHCAYPRFRIYVMVDTTSYFAKSRRETLHHYCQSFHLKVSTSSCINLFKWILYFIVHIWGLRFRKQQIQCCAHYEEWGGSFAPLLLSFSLENFCKFMQVSTSSCINLFKWIIYFTSGFWLLSHWCCSIIFASSYLNSLAHLWLSTPVLFESFAFTSFHYCCYVKVFASSCADHQSQNYCWFVKFYKFNYHEGQAYPWVIRLGMSHLYFHGPIKLSKIIGNI